MTCRPKFAYEPSISNYTTGITLQVQMQTNTSGWWNCGPLQAEIQVYETTNDTLIKTETLNDTQIAAYSVNPNRTHNIESKELYEIEIPDDDGCYLVKISYGQEGLVASTVEETT